MAESQKRDQRSEKKDPQGEKRHLRELVKDFRYAMLVTRGEEGDLRGRPMAVSQVEGDADLWFATGLDTLKVAEMEQDPRVGVTLQDDDRYVSLSGRARLVRDKAKIAELWSEYMKPWFPEGKDDPNLVLVHVEVERGEFWDSTGIKGLRYFFESVKAYVQGTTPEPVKGLHGEVQK